MYARTDDGSFSYFRRQFAQARLDSVRLWQSMDRLYERVNVKESQNHFYWNWLRIALLLVCFSPVASRNWGPRVNAGVHSHVDLFGDTLPAQALARLGTVRFRHAHRVVRLKWLPGEKMLLSVTPNTICQWDISTGRSIHNSIVKDNLEWIEIASNGKLLAKSDQDGTVQVIDTETGKRISSLRGHSKEVVAIAFSADGRMLASGGSDADIRIWDLHTHKECMLLRGHTGWVHALRFFPDGKTLVSGSHDETIRFWDLNKGKEWRDWQMTEKNTHRIGVSPDGKKIVVSTTDDTIIINNAITHRQERKITVPVHNFCFSPDSSLLASLHESRVVLWSVETGDKCHVIKPGAQQGEFSPDGKYLLVANGGVIRKLDVSNGKDASPATGHLGDIESVAISSNGRILYSWSTDHALKVWDCHTGKCLNTYWLGTDVRCAAFSPLGTQLALGSYKGNLVIVDPRKGTKLFSLPAFKESVDAVCFSHDGCLLAAISTDGTLGIWDVNRRLLLHTIQHQHPILGLAFSWGRQLLAIKNVFQTVSLVDLNTRSIQRTLPVESRVGSIVFTPDDTALIAPGEEDKPGIAQFWSVNSTSLFASIGTPGWAISSLALSSDGSILAIGGENGDIHLWETITGKRIATLRSHSGVIQVITFSADNQLLVTAGGDTTILVWNLALLSTNVQSSLKPFDAQTLQVLWTDLAGHDSSKAHSAVQVMSTQKQLSIEFLKPRLVPTIDKDLRQIRRLINQLDDTDFTERQSATERLTELGAEASPLLRQALISRPPLEARKRIESILRSAFFIRSATALRQIRAIQILEQIGSPDAQSILERLANGSPVAIQTIYAQHALRRVIARRLKTQNESNPLHAGQ